MIIRPLVLSDVEGLNTLPPLDWKFNYEGFLKSFLSEEYFYGFVLEEEGEIVGTGNVLLKDRVGWLANIIVNEKCRGRGLGFKMTKFLVDFLKTKDCETQLLLATELGQSVYRKVGFRKISDYRCFDTNKKIAYNSANFIRKLKTTDLPLVKQLDQETNGENRFHLINKFFQDGFGYFGQDQELLGCYLPNFGRGLVLAKEKLAGLALLKLKHAKGNQRTLLPIENKAGIHFFENNGSVEGPTLAKMIIGKECVWKPENIYSYGSGYCG